MTGYRIRARAVDLAGQSVGRTRGPRDPFAAPRGRGHAALLRYEPVNPPVLVDGSCRGRAARCPAGHPQPQQRPVAGRRARRPRPTSGTSRRPAAAVQLVEQHGMLDDATGGLRGDAATYAVIVGRDRGQFATVGDTPIEPGQQLAVPYFPDPLARGAALAEPAAYPGRHSEVR